MLADPAVVIPSRTVAVELSPSVSSPVEFGAGTRTDPPDIAAPFELGSAAGADRKTTTDEGFAAVTVPGARSEGPT